MPRLLQDLGTCIATPATFRESDSRTMPTAACLGARCAWICEFLFSVARHAWGGCVDQGGLEASARMHITASNFLVYENTALVVTGEKSFPALASPEVKLNDLTLACLPVQSPHDGKPSPWQLASDGSLHIDASQASIAGLTDLTLPYLSSAPGGLCQVRNATRHTVAIPVLLPKTWTSISYPFESVFVAPGTTFGPAMNPHGHDNGEQGCVAPSRYSASCTAPGVEIVFDELTGVVSAFGFSLFRLDTQTGSIDVSPEQDAGTFTHPFLWYPPSPRL